MILKINIHGGLYYGNGEILNLLEEGEFYNKYVFKNDNDDKFLLYLINDFDVDENEIISFIGNLESPSKQRNRGGFDYSKYMYSQNFYGSIFIDNVNDIEVVEESKFNLITFIQNSIFDKLSALLPKEQLGILLGMIIGDTVYISEGVEEAFKSSGITHLLAVSGSNVAYVIVISKFLFNKVFGKSFSNIISIFMIIIFVLISGASPSVVRAGIMSIILILSEVLSRQPDTKATIAVTATLILLYNPFIICDVGFVLSFGGTIGIVALNTQIIDLFNKKYLIFLENKIFKYIIETLSITLSAQIVLLPIMWYYFNTISFISIITNLLVAPFTGIITILGLIIYFASFIFYPIAKLLSYSIYFLISLMILISRICSMVPFGNITLPNPNFIIIILYYLIVCYFFFFKNREKGQYKFISNDNYKRIERRILSGIVSVLIIIQILVIIIPKNYIEINIIDVGQGDSTLIKSNNCNILIDGGGSENSDYDVGKQILIPYLLDNTNGVIDLMIISHFHEDHAEGCISVLKELKVKKVVIGVQPKMTNLYEQLLELTKEKNIPLIILSGGDKFTIDNIRFEILYPQNNLQIKDDLNNNSLVIKVKYYETSILLTGDIEKEAENILSAKELDVDILKVAHHGSKTSTTRNFLEATTPKIALISLGKDNKFGHPNKEVLDRLKKIKSEIYRTDESGEISLKVFKNGLLKISTQIK